MALKHGRAALAAGSGTPGEAIGSNNAPGAPYGAGIHGLFAFFPSHIVRGRSLSVSLLTGESVIHIRVIGFQFLSPPTERKNEQDFKQWKKHLRTPRPPRPWSRTPPLALVPNVLFSRQTMKSNPSRWRLPLQIAKSLIFRRPNLATT